MEMKTVQRSGNSTNEGLNLGAGMLQPFSGNRRRHSEDDGASVAHRDVASEQLVRLTAGARRHGGAGS